MSKKKRKQSRRGRILALAVVCVIAAIAVSIYVLTFPPPFSEVSFQVGPATSGDLPAAGTDPCLTHPQGPLNITGVQQPLIANYDKQVWAIMNQNAVSLSYNITAVEQSDSSGYGPAYLLNGDTEAGYWYQTGIAWNWVTKSDVGHTNGFSFFVQVYQGNAQLVNVLSPIEIHGGDEVTLNMTISKSTNQVLMRVHDWNTSASEQYQTNAFGATQFIGNLHNTSNPTSLLVEAYGRNLVCSLSSVKFASKSNHLGYGIRVDEWNFTGITTQDRFSGNPQWSYPANGVAPTGTINGCLTYLGTTACVSTT